MSKFTTVRLRTDLRKRVDRIRKQFKGRRQKPLNDVVAAAVDALEQFPKEQQEALIDGRPLAPAQS